MDKTTVLILFGGVSTEHEVSCRSVGHILPYMDMEKYTVSLVGITKAGAWFLTCASPEEIADGRWEKRADNKPACLVPDRQVHGILVQEEDQWKALRMDCVWPILHGKNGEDGTIQGLCELAGLPYVGPGVLASAVCMDKATAKIIVHSLGVKQALHLSFSRQQICGDIQNVLTTIDSFFPAYPLFVKPCAAGSSVGVSKVSNFHNLQKALQEAATHDSHVIVEEMIFGRELEIGVLGNGDPITSPVGEVVTNGVFYDYDAKCTAQGSKSIVPANIPDEVTREVQDTAVLIYKALGCKGLSRIDFFLSAKGEVLFNEVNTLPGLTPLSLFPVLWVTGGTPIDELIDRLILLSMEGE